MHCINCRKPIQFMACGVPKNLSAASAEAIREVIVAAHWTLCTAPPSNTLAGLQDRMLGRYRRGT